MGIEGIFVGLAAALLSFQYFRDRPLPAMLGGRPAARVPAAPEPILRHLDDGLPIEAVDEPIGHLDGRPFYDRIRAPDGRNYRFYGAARLRDGVVDRRCLPRSGPTEFLLLAPNHIYVPDDGGR